MVKDKVLVVAQVCASERLRLACYARVIDLGRVTLTYKSQHMSVLLLQVMVFQGPLVAMEVDYVDVVPGQTEVRPLRPHARHSLCCCDCLSEDQRSGCMSAMQAVSLHDGASASQSSCFTSAHLMCNLTRHAFVLCGILMHVCRRCR